MSFPDSLQAGPLGLSCEHLNHSTGDTPVTVHLQDSCIQTAVFPGTGLGNFTPQLEWPPEFSSLISLHSQPQDGHDD